VGGKIKEKRMKKTRFIVLSRREAEGLRDENILNDTVVISIHGLDEKPANIQLSCPILYLQFDDIEQSEEHCHNNVHRAELIKEKLLPFNKDMARNIFDFVNAHKPSTIIVHCHAGVCRSAAVAAALSKIMYDEDDYIFKTRVPNMLVYTTMLEYYYCDQYELSANQFMQQQAYLNHQSHCRYK
jgi:predicted protein tyrosine phosphatase